ncbi:MAG: hypothetical protein Q4C42_02425 [Clostridia bacterium]|nr:hypothetical protein [Clostridia bacterium]
MKNWKKLATLFMAVMLVFSFSALSISADETEVPDYTTDEGGFDDGYDDGIYDEDDTSSDDWSDETSDETSGDGEFSNQDLNNDGTTSGYEGWNGGNDYEDLVIDDYSEPDNNDYNYDYDYDYDDNGDTSVYEGEESSETQPTVAPATPKPAGVTTPAPTSKPTEKPSASPEAKPSEKPANSPTPEAENSNSGPNYQIIGQISERETRFSGDFGLWGIILIAVGVVGILCVIIWSAATRDREKDEIDEIYETVGNASRDNAQREKAKKAAPSNPYSYDDNYSYVQSKGRTAQRPVKPVGNTGAIKPSGNVQKTRKPKASGATGSINVVNTVAQQKKAKSSSKYDTADIDSLLRDVLGEDKK